MYPESKDHKKSQDSTKSIPRPAPIPTRAPRPAITTPTSVIAPVLTPSIQVIFGHTLDQIVSPTFSIMRNFTGVQINELMPKLFDQRLIAFLGKLNQLSNDNYNTLFPFLEHSCRNNFINNLFNIYASLTSLRPVINSIFFKIIQRYSDLESFTKSNDMNIQLFITNNIEKIIQDLPHGFISYDDSFTLQKWVTDNSRYIPDDKTRIIGLIDEKKCRPPVATHTSFISHSPFST